MTDAGIPFPTTVSGRHLGFSPEDLVDARESFQKQLGLALTSIHGFAELLRSSAPVTVMAGEFSHDRTDEAVRSDPRWSDALGVAEHDGIEYWSWLEDGEHAPDLADRTCQLGEATRLAVDVGCLCALT